MERIFSENDISAIIQEAELNVEQYLGGMFISGEATETTIFTISKNKRLIFVEGNTDTGYNHLKDRHGYFSFKNYWRQDNNGLVTLDDPSKFNPQMMPFVNYVEIAETIFCIENKNFEKNKRPDVFDMFTGTYSFLSDEPQKYHLLTYKDTKIVHTLFPDKKKYNLKKKIKYGKGVVTTELRFPEAVNDLLVPYLNNEGITVYSLLIRKFYSEKTEKIFIQLHDENGKVKEMLLLGYRLFEDFERFEHEEMLQFQHNSLYEYENIICEIDARKKVS